MFEIICLLILAAPALVMAGALGVDLLAKLSGRCEYCGFSPCARNCQY
jgi:hypothetical protein